MKILDKCLTNMPSIQTGIFENVCKKNNLTAKIYTSINVKSGVVKYMKIWDKCQAKMPPKSTTRIQTGRNM